MAKPYVIGDYSISNPSALRFLEECENLLDEELEPDNLVSYFDYGVGFVEGYHSEPGEMDDIVRQAAFELFRRESDVDEDSIDPEDWESCCTSVELDGIELNEWSARYVTVAEMFLFGMDEEKSLRGHLKESQIAALLDYLYGFVDEEEMPHLAEQAVESI